MAKDTKQDWQIGVIRATAFVINDIEMPLNIWKKIIDQDPEKSIDELKNRKKYISGKIQIEKEIIKLSCQTSPGRIDLIFQPIDQEAVSGFPAIGQFSEIIDHYQRIILKFFLATPQSYRLAISPVLIKEAIDRPSGYKELQKYLPLLQIDPDNSSDLFYQINRRKIRKIEDSEYVINRLNKWNVVELQMAEMHAIIGKESDPVIREEKRYFVCRLEMDINNLPDSPKELNLVEKEALSNIFFEYAIDMAKNGDIR